MRRVNLTQQIFFRTSSHVGSHKDAGKLNNESLHRPLYKPILAQCSISKPPENGRGYRNGT